MLFGVTTVRTIVGSGCNQSSGGCVAEADGILCALMRVRGVKAYVCEHGIEHIHSCRLQPASSKQHCVLNDTLLQTGRP